MTGPYSHAEEISIQVDLEKKRADIAKKYPSLPSLMRTRHLAVLELWAHGLNNEEIALALTSDPNDDYMTARTVNTYKKGIKDALKLYAGPGVHPEIDAMCLATYWVWVLSKAG